MSKNVRTQLGKVVGKSLNGYHARVKPKIDELKFKEQYQGRIIDCMVGEVDDNYIETPETDSAIVKLEHSKEGLVKVPSIKGKTILVDSDGNETDTPAEGCRLVSVGEEEDNKLIILSNNKNLFNEKNFIVKTGSSWHYVDIKNLPTVVFNGKGYARLQHNYSKLEFYTTNKLPTGNAYDEWQLKGVMDVPYNVEGNIRFNVNNNLNHKYLIIFQASTNLNNYAFREFSVTTEIPTTYIEPKCHKTEILLDEPLRSLSDEVCDKVVGNNLVRKTKKVLITENDNMWLYENKQEKNTIAIGVNNALINDWYRRLAKSNIFNRAGSVIFDQEGFSHGDSGASVFIRINKERLPSENLAGFKNWLSENPIEIIYELEEPIIEELPNGITLQGFDDTTMYIENTITPTVTYGYNALIPYKEELRTQKKEVETNTLDIENNIIPYLMDMEFNLMLMEDNE